MVGQELLPPTSCGGAREGVVVMQRNSKRQGAMFWLWVGLAVVLLLAAAWVLIGAFA